MSIANKFRCRCSSIGKLMSGKIGLTEKQEAELYSLEQRHATNLPKPLTPNLVKKMEELKDKKDNAELTETPKTLAREWFLSKHFDKKKEFSSKQTEKGDSVEESAIYLIQEYFDLGLCWKNTEHFADEFFTGTPDLNLLEEVIDIKCPYSVFTMPFFDDKPNDDYYGQLQGYMHLTGKKKAKLVYCLMDMPEEIVSEMAWKKIRWDKTETRSHEEVYWELYQEHAYSDFPPEERIVAFEINYDEAYIKEAQQRILMARKYIVGLEKGLAANQLKLEGLYSTDLIAA